MLAPPKKLIEVIDKALAVSPSHHGTANGTASLLKILKHCRARIEADSAWPSHQEELTRKAIDTAHALAVRHHEGELSQEAAHAAMGAIIDTTQGLINRDVLDAINTAYRRLRA